VSEPRYVVRNVDPTDPDQVFEWSRGACRSVPFRLLLTEAQLARGVEPTEEAVLEAMRAGLPPETQEAAVQGCHAGLALRREDESQN
jgi:hypothetical protein